jgi:hypothetical protein
MNDSLMKDYSKQDEEKGGLFNISEGEETMGIKENRGIMFI